MLSRSPCPTHTLLLLRRRRRGRATHTPLPPRLPVRHVRSTCAAHVPSDEHVRAIIATKASDVKKKAWPDAPPEADRMEDHHAEHPEFGRWRRGLSFHQSQTRSSPRLLDNDDGRRTTAASMWNSSTMNDCQRCQPRQRRERRELTRTPDNGGGRYSCLRRASAGTASTRVPEAACQARTCEDTASQPVKRRYWQVASEIVACGGRARLPPVCVS